MKQPKIIPFITLFAMLLLGYRSNAQWQVGGQGGIAITQLVSDISNRPERDYLPGNGVYAAVPVWRQWRVGKFLVGANTSASFVRKAYYLWGTGSLTNKYQYSANSYLQIPITANCSYSILKMHFFLCAGVYGGYWLSGKTEGRFVNILYTTANNNYYHTYSEPYSFDDGRDQRIELGWCASIGVMYPVWGKINAIFQVDSYRSLTDQQKDYMLAQIPRYNNTYTISLGLLKKLSL